jgi:hypothetical protein
MSLEIGQYITLKFERFQIGEMNGRDSSVGITTGYGLDGLGSVLGMRKRLFFSPQRPDRL